MAKVHVKMDSRGVREYLRGESVRDMLKGRADAVAERANSSLSANGFTGAPGYAAAVGVQSDRAVAAVTAVNEHAARADAKRNNLLKAMDAGR